MINEDFTPHINKARDLMEKTIHHLEAELSKVRAGKANPALVNDIKVDYYGSPTPLNQISTIKLSDPKTIVIQPWEKQMLGPIEKAILAANIGITPQGDGNLIRLNMPPLTEERRKELVKKIKEIGEECRVAVRNVRRETNELIKKLQKTGFSEDAAKKAEKDSQEMTDKYIKLIDKHLEVKEQEIMTV